MLMSENLNAPRALPPCGLPISPSTNQRAPRVAAISQAMYQTARERSALPGPSIVNTAKRPSSPGGRKVFTSVKHYRPNTSACARRPLHSRKTCVVTRPLRKIRDVAKARRASSSHAHAKQNFPPGKILCNAIWTIITPKTSMDAITSKAAITGEDATKTTNAKSASSADVTASRIERDTLYTTLQHSSTPIHHLVILVTPSRSGKHLGRVKLQRIFIDTHEIRFPVEVPSPILILLANTRTQPC
jgi:hypothetical protein